MPKPSGAGFRRCDIARNCAQIDRRRLRYRRCYRRRWRELQPRETMTEDDQANAPAEDAEDAAGRNTSAPGRT